MMNSKSPIKYAIVNAFTDSMTKGNPAAVCIMEEERDETWMQSVAKELNTPVTCFLTWIKYPNGDTSSIPNFKLRWFTPITQIKLCGHATLAASHHFFTSGLVMGDTIEYSTLSGILTAKKTPKDSIELDFPLIPLTDYSMTPISFISEALNGASVEDVKQTTTENDLIVVLDSIEDIAKMQPNFEKIHSFPSRGMIVTTLAQPESKFDFISRFFFPKIGINEDEVCGSAHCALANYWSKKLAKRDFLAYAASARGGVVKLHLDETNNRVILEGKAVLVMEDSLLVESL